MNKSEFSVTEIFKGIQGEGIMAGIPMDFIRLAGCSLGCKYCDTRYSWNGPVEIMSLGQIGKKLQKYPKINWVYITGGEPFEHSNLHELVIFLKSRNLKIGVATNGTFLPPYWHGLVDYWITDIKCPSAGVGNPSKIDEWGKVGRPQDEMKFVVGTKEDLKFVEWATNTFWIGQTTVISPVLITGKSDTDMDWAKYVWEFCIQNNFRFSLQLHKILFGNKRGV